MKGSPGGAPILTLYSRQWCHLCRDMEQALLQLQRDVRFDMEVFDIDADPQLEAQFNERVPVLEGDGKELCHYVLDVAAVRAYLSDFR
jgi:thiol-disulfide isomerase/thioredoxin